MDSDPTLSQPTQTTVPRTEDPTTELSIIANVTRVVTRVVDRLTGDRVDYPLLVAVACVEALKAFQIQSRVMFGQVAWIEILENQSAVWAGCWGENFHFWVATQFGEIIDLNTSVAHRKRSHSAPQWKAIYSPPMIWSAELPYFYRCIPEGIAELDLLETRDQKHYENAISEVRKNCTPEQLLKEDPANLSFPNEAILCPGRRVLDDNQESFKHFDRALSIYGVPESPI